MTVSLSLLLLLACPLVGTLAMALVPARAPRALFELLHLVVIGMSAALSLCVVVQVMAGKTLVAFDGWFMVDWLGAVFVALIGVVGLLVGVYSIPYIRHDVEAGNLQPAQIKVYYAFFSLFIFTMLVCAAANNIIMMWVAVEATTLGTVFLVGIYSKKLSLEAAWKYIIICATGVAFGLYATILVYANANEVMANPHHAAFWTDVMGVAGSLDSHLMAIAFVFAAIGFGTKAGLFPMHTWLPDAHAEAPSPVSALLSGVLLKCAILVIIRFYTLCAQSMGWFFPQLVMVILGALSLVVAAFFIFAQHDLKRKFAYHSSENIGLIALCLGFGGPVGVFAALVHCVAHGLVKALMFCLSGNVLITYGTRDTQKITGVIEAAPVTGALMFLGLLALAGFPPFAMFWSELLAVVAGVQAGNWVLVVIVPLALTVVIAAIARLINGSVLRRPPEGITRKEVSPFLLIPEVILLVLIVWMGAFTPPAVTSLLHQATGVVLHVPADSLEQDIGNQGMPTSVSVQSLLNADEGEK